MIPVKPSVLASNIMDRCSGCCSASATYSYSNKWVWSGWVQLMRVVLLHNCTHCSGKYFSAEEIYSSWFNCSLDANLHWSSFSTAFYLRTYRLCCVVLQVRTQYPNVNNILNKEHRADGVQWQGCQVINHLRRKPHIWTWSSSVY